MGETYQPPIRLERDPNQWIEFPFSL